MRIQWSVLELDARRLTSVLKCFSVIFSSSTLIPFVFASLSFDLVCNAKLFFIRSFFSYQLDCSFSLSPFFYLLYLCVLSVDLHLLPSQWEVEGGTMCAKPYMGHEPVLGDKRDR